MNRDVVTIRPDMPLKRVAAILSANHISGAPVCNPAGDVVGVISEADILRKEEGVRPDVGGRFNWLLRKLDGETAKVGARTAGEAMTSPALTIRATEPVSTAAQLMVERSINRLPVVSDGELVGIVTRADLVRAFHRSDDEIAREIRDEVLVHALWLAPEALSLDVRSGVVAIRGTVETEADADVAVRLIRRIPGVVDVQHDLRPRVRRTRDYRVMPEVFLG